MPAWLIGGIVGIAYLVITFLFEFVVICNFRIGGMCGTLTAFANLPATLLLSGNLPLYLVLPLYLIVNFILAGLLFELIHQFWKWQDSK